MKLKAKNIHLDDGWTGCTVCPRSVSMPATGYRKGSCPKAEEVVQSIVTLPTHMTTTPNQAEYIIDQLKL